MQPHAPVVGGAPGKASPPLCTGVVCTPHPLSTAARGAQGLGCHLWAGPGMTLPAPHLPTGPGAPDPTSGLGFPVGVKAEKCLMRWGDQHPEALGTDSWAHPAHCCCVPAGA